MALKDQVLAAAETYTKSKNPKLRWDEWNYFYSQITNQPGPNPEQFGFKRRADNQGMLDVDPMDVNFWWAKVSTVIAGAGAPGTVNNSTPGGNPATGQPTGATGSGGTGSANSNVFLDTLLMLLSIVFAGRTI